MSIKKPFSGAVRALAQQAQKTVHLPGKWVEADHPYIRDINLDFYTTTQLYRSEHGAYGIAIQRTQSQIAAELFASRAGYLASVPVSPTFLMHDKERVLSVIAFDEIVYGLKGIDNHAHYLQHEASALPFFLWMGNDMDRRITNVVGNAKCAHEFAEFDFECTNLSQLFHTYREPLHNLPPQLHDVARMSQQSLLDDAMKLSNAALVKSEDIAKKPFNKAYRRLWPLFESIAYKTLSLLVKDGVIAPYTKQQAQEYFMIRHMALMLGKDNIGKDIKKPANAQSGQVLGTVYKFN